VGQFLLLCFGKRDNFVLKGMVESKKSGNTQTPGTINIMAT
jgi:hypothetical protein